MQLIQNLPTEILKQPRFFPVARNKAPLIKDWSNPNNQKLFCDIQQDQFAGFDTCGHGRASDYLFLDFDHVQNYLRHGLPNYIHDWSLEPNLFDEQKKKKKPRKCPDCQSIISYKVKTCPFCGYVFPDSSVHITEVDANLSLINTNTSEPKKIVSQERIKHAFTKPEEFMSIAIERGYKIGWVAFQSLKHASSYEDCLHIADICKYNKGWAYHKWQEISPTILQNARLLC